MTPIPPADGDRRPATLRPARARPASVGHDRGPGPDPRQHRRSGATASPTSPRDFISATRLAASEIELARATGDISAYLAADAAVDGALKADADYPLALDYRGVVQVALHRFADARDERRRRSWPTRPDDPTALATLGDASLELGDVAAAAGAYADSSPLDDSAAARVRLSHLAFIQGRTDDAVGSPAPPSPPPSTRTPSAAPWPGIEYQLGDTLIATGDRTGAAAAYAAAARRRPALRTWRTGASPGSPPPTAGSTTPSPRSRRGDRHRAAPRVPRPPRRPVRIRAADGDARREADDRKTVLAIAQLAGDAASVYDRTLALYLAGYRRRPGAVP